MNILFLDDSPQRTSKFMSKVPLASNAWTAKECIAFLEKDTEWNFVLLDHDLSGEVMVKSDREDCGMKAVRWIVENKPKIEHIVVHSLNQPVVEEMKNKLIDAGYEVTVLPFIRFDQSNIYKILNGEN